MTNLDPTLPDLNPNPPDKLPKTKTLHYLFDSSSGTDSWHPTEAAAKFFKKVLIHTGSKRNAISIQPVDIPTDKKLLAAWLTERGVQP